MTSQLLGSHNKTVLLGESWKPSMMTLIKINSLEKENVFCPEWFCSSVFFVRRVLPRRCFAPKLNNKIKIYDTFSAVDQTDIA